ncbi:MAG: hypothetical protein FWH14_06325 [Oscillospiraceae bacterium]|nr:hypothetical protein [Oscillospiraceae bacterium]
MNDVFFEQIVPKRPEKKDAVKGVLILLGTLAVFSLLLFLAAFMRELAPLIILAALGVFYLGVLLYRNLSVEFEYIITNGELDVDKIIAKRKRKRILSVNVKTFDARGSFSKDEQLRERYDTKIFACSHIDDTENMYAIFSHKTFGKTLLVITPNQKIEENIKRYVRK